MKSERTPVERGTSGLAQRKPVTNGSRATRRLARLNEAGGAIAQRLEYDRTDTRDCHGGLGGSSGQLGPTAEAAGIGDAPALPETGEPDGQRKPVPVQPVLLATEEGSTGVVSTSSPPAQEADRKRQCVRVGSTSSPRAQWKQGHPRPVRCSDSSSDSDSSSEDEPCPLPVR